MGRGGAGRAGGWGFSRAIASVRGDPKHIPLIAPPGQPLLLGSHGFWVPPIALLCRSSCPAGHAGALPSCSF